MPCLAAAIRDAVQRIGGPLFKGWRMPEREERRERSALAAEISD